MSERHLHIISFDIPYPPNYGGVIDVFFKIRALHAAGVKIHLHCFEYHRKRAPELEQYCTEVNYYRRKNNLFSALTFMPYIVYSRRDPALLKNLLRDRHPILFEGLHSCYYLSHRALKDRVRVYRESNIEHQYYYHLSKTEKNIFRKLFFIFSGLKLQSFEETLSHATLMLTVSQEDNEYLRTRFPGKRTEYLPSFHHDDAIRSEAGTGDYVLYQGNLSVGENRKAAEYLVRNIFSKVKIPFTIAGMNPPDSLKKLASAHPHIRLVENPAEEEMFNLIRNAQVNLMVTFQPTGLKLKLLHALFNGRFCLVNKHMVHGTELGSLCEIADTPDEIISALTKLMNRQFTGDMILSRSRILLQWHSNSENCKRLMEFVYLFEKKNPK